VDGMTVKELKEWLMGNLDQLGEQLLEGQYQPQSVRGVRIPKPKVNYRRLGLHTVKDRLVQQAISQVLIGNTRKVFAEQLWFSSEAE
jgi:RNA-directed DNA polymerase